MCTATTTLYYGIAVKAMDFCLLAAAYDRSRPALLAIDLILARRARGRLEVENSVMTDVRALPAEVWDLVKGELIDRAFDKERKRFARRHLELDCPCCACCAAGKPGDRFADVFECDLAYQELIEGEGVAGFVGPHEKVRPLSALLTLCVTDSASLVSQAATKLLADFGLCLASHELISVDESPWTDLDSAWAIALPFATDDKGRCPSARTALRHEYGSTHALSAISPSTFVLPADADTRFRRILSTFPILEPVSLTSDTIRPRAEQDTALQADDKGAHEGDKAQMSEAQRREAAARARRIASEPRWVLWTEGDSCI